MVKAGIIPAFFVHNIIMNTLFLSLKKSPKYLAYPFIFISGFLLLINFVNLFPLQFFKPVYEYIENNIDMLFGVLAVYFIVSFSTNSLKGIASSICYAFCDIVQFSATNNHLSIIFSVVVAFIITLVVKDIDLLYCFFMLLIISIIFGILIAISSDLLVNVRSFICSFVSDKPLLFGAFNNAYSLFFNDSFGELFYTKDYSSTMIINDSIVSGVKNIFIADTENPPMIVSSLMTGKYFVNSFVSFGIFVALYKKFNDNELSAFALLFALSFLFGDVKLFALFILLYNPILYVAYLFLTFISYLVPALIDMRIGYVYNGSLIELIKYGNRWAYFLIIGIVIAFLSYFVVRFVNARFNLEDRKILPKEIRKIINSLGGEENIRSVNKKCVVVNNPNLVNILNLDCDIYGNEIILHYGELEKLNEYY